MKISEIKLNLNLTTLIIIGAVLLIVFGGGWKYITGKNDSLKTELQAEVKLKDALLDSIKYHKNKYKEVVAEKLTIQLSLDELGKLTNQLTAGQRDLLNRVKEIDKKNSIITAALIKTNIKLDSLRQGIVDVDTINKTITVKDSLKDIKYNILVSHVVPAYKNVKPTLTFKEFSMPNTQLVEFHWKDNEKDKGYPILFSVSNSNKYFKTVNIDSYAIPQLNKIDVDPNGWQKFTKWVNKKGNFVITVGVAGAAGAAIGHFLLK